MSNGGWNYLLPTHPFHAPLIVAGHVGFSLDKGQSIFGFEPKIKYTPKALLDSYRLKKRVPLEGKITNNTDLFHRAANQRYTLLEESLNVFAYEVEVSDEIYSEIEKDISGRSLKTKYAFPNKKEPFFKRGVANCATYLAKYNIPIPEENGWMYSYMAKIHKMPKARKVHYFTPNGEVSSMYKIRPMANQVLETTVFKQISSMFPDLVMTSEEFPAHRLVYLKRLFQIYNESQSHITKDDLENLIYDSRHIESPELASFKMYELNKTFGKPALRTLPKRVGKSCIHYIRAFLGKKSNVFN